MKSFTLAAHLALASLFGVALHAQEKPAYTRTGDVIYGRKFGTALTLDVFEPEKKNGAAVFWIVSSGLVSSHGAIRPGQYAALLERGYTVFAVVHGSQPRFIITEIYEDVHRAVRFVRHNAGRWNVDPNKFGVSGASAGGVLSLTLGTQGKPGPADAKDPIDRVSSAVQAAACFFPSTDLLNYSRPGEDMIDFEPMRALLPAFGPRVVETESRRVLAREISPIYHVTAAMAPTLVVQGDADKLVPLYQAQVFEQKCREVGATFKLIVKPGVGHGWPGIEQDVAIFADWFDEHLRAIKTKE